MTRPDPGWTIIDHGIMVGDEQEPVTLVHDPATGTVTAHLEYDAVMGWHSLPIPVDELARALGLTPPHTAPDPGTRMKSHGPATEPRSPGGEGTGVGPGTSLPGAVS